MKTRLLAGVLVMAVSAPQVAAAQTDVVLEWNARAVQTMMSQGQNPFNQARLAAITQLAVFEAVNAITREYEPYVGIVAPVGASADAAAIVAAHDVLVNYLPGAVTALDAARDTSLAAIPDGTAKDNGIQTGQIAAAALIALRTGDGSSPPAFYTPGTPEPGVWQTTPTCGTGGGAFYHWSNVTLFGTPSNDFGRPGPPPDLASSQYVKDYQEVKRAGSSTASTTDRPADRALVARFYAAASPTFVFNSAARQIAAAQGRTLSENARALALLNMAASDALVVSFATKYHYTFWRPETAIRAGDTDGNDKTDPDTSFAPYVSTPCFPGYPSNHASGSNASAELLRRLYGEGEHVIAITSPTLGVTLNYTTLNGICNDIDDARVYGGIHFRFDQDAGGRLGRDVATYVYKNNLRKAAGQ